MIKWNERPKEVAYLFNPAFCAQLLYVFAFSYNKQSGKNVPISLLFLTLPIVLNERDKKQITSRTSFMNWVTDNSELLSSFAKGASSYVPFSKEAIELAFNCRLFSLDNDGFIKVSNCNYMFDYSGRDEIRHYFKKAEYLGRMMAKMNSEVIIFSCLGVKP